MTKKSFRFKGKLLRLDPCRTFHLNSPQPQILQAGCLLFVKEHNNEDFVSWFSWTLSPWPLAHTLKNKIKWIFQVVVNSVQPISSSLSILSSSIPYPTRIYLIQVNNRSTTTSCESVQRRRYWHKNNGNYNRQL